MNFSKWGGNYTAIISVTFTRYFSKFNKFLAKCARETQLLELANVCNATVIQ
jgi:hypothetical protein